MLTASLTSSMTPLLLAASAGVVPRVVIPGEEAHVTQHMLQPASPMDQFQCSPAILGPLWRMSTGFNVAFASNGNGDISGPTEPPQRTIEEERAWQQAQEIDARLSDPTDDITWLGLEEKLQVSEVGLVTDLLGRTTRALREDDCLNWALKIERRLRDLSLYETPARVGAHVYVLGRLTWRLPVEYQLECIRTFVRYAVESPRYLLPEDVVFEILDDMLSYTDDTECLSLARDLIGSSEINLRTLDVVEAIATQLDPSYRRMLAHDIEEIISPHLHAWNFELWKIAQQLLESKCPPWWLKIEAYLEHQDTATRMEAVNFFKEIFHDLPAEQRLAPVMKIKARLEDPDPNIRKAALDCLKEIAPQYLPEEKDWANVLKIDARLEELSAEERRGTLEDLKDITHVVPEGELVELAVKIEPHPMDIDPSVRVAAVETLSKIILRLPIGDRLKWLLKIEERLQDPQDPDEEVRAATVRALGDITPHLPEEDRAVRATKIANCLQDKFVRKSALLAFKNILPHLPSEEQLAYALKCEAILMDPELNLGMNPVPTLLEITENLAEEDQLTLALEVEARLENTDTGARLAAFLALSNKIPHFPTARRLARFQKIVTSFITLLRDQDQSTRGNAAAYIESISRRYLRKEERFALFLKVKALRADIIRLDVLGQAPYSLTRDMLVDLRTILDSDTFHFPDNLESALILEAYLEDVDPDLRRSAIKELQYVIQSLPEEERLMRTLKVEARLQDMDPRVREVALDVLSYLKDISDDE